ncbi:hypothetical protein ACIPPM_11705 [Streptomyces sp. NPDC090119]|uniref:hypothetical protein n=1 Tax=Streptomyces sp. NPDC090119 TaxID=3365951 RepID=UPI00380164C7
MSARNRRLPRGYSWPLTSTDLTESLGPLMTHVTETRFLTGRDAGTIVLGAAWVPPLFRNYGRDTHPDAVGFRIDVPMVPTPARATTRTILRDRALPQLRDWITLGIQAGETWHLTPHERLWHLTGGHLTHEDAAV